MSKVSNYIKNVGKSMGYMAVDIIEENNPIIKGFIDTNKSTVEEMYSNIKNIKNGTGSLKNNPLVREYTEVLNTGYNNMIEDLKSGNFYNKERINKVNDAMSKSMGFDFDMDFNFDDDMSFDDEEPKAMTSADMDNIGSKIANAQASSTFRSAEYIVSSNRESTKLLLSQSNRLFNQITSGFGLLNNNLSTMNTLIQPVTTHIQNSSLFYTKSTELQTKQVELLTKLVEQTAPVKTVNNRSNSTNSRKKISDMVDYEGVVDLGEVVSNIKSNVSDMVSSITGIGDMFKSDSSVGAEGNMFNTIFASPIQTAVKVFAGNILPKIMTDTMQEFNKSIGGFIGSMFMKVNNASSFNPILGKLLEALGFDNRLKKDIDTGKYEKGRVDFNGIANKSITEVIPTLLAKIYSSVSGTEELRYDYSKGKFVTIGKIIAKKDDYLNGEARSTSSDLKYEMQDLKDFKSKSKKDQELIQEALIAFTKSSINSGQFTNINKEFTEKDYNKLGITPEVGAMLFGLMKQIGSGGKRNINTKFNLDVMRSRDSITSYMESLENNGTGVLGNYYNDSMAKDKNGKLLAQAKSPLDFNNMIDNLGNNVFFYLQGIFQNTLHLSDNVGLGGGKGSGSRKVKAMRSIVSNIQNSVQEEKVYDLDTEFTEDKFKSLAKGSKKTSAEIKDLYDQYVSSDDGNKKAIIESLRKDEYDIKNNKTKKKTFIDKLLEKGSINGKLETVLSTYNELSSKPLEIVTNMMDKADKTLYSLVYGDEKNKGKGFLDVILERTSGLFEKMNTFVDESILTPLKEKIEKIDFKSLFDKVLEKFNVNPKDLLDGVMNKFFGEKIDGKRTGGSLSQFTNDLKANAKGAAKWVGNSIKNVFVGDKSKATAFNGGEIEKTGMIAVSEGEIVIPAEYNPLYTKPINKKKQKLNEANAVNRYFGSFDTGGVVEDPMGKVKEFGSKLKNKSVDIMKGLFAKDGPLGVSVKKLKDGIDATATELVGDEKKQAQSKAKFTGILENLMKEFGTSDNIAGAVVGGVIGGGASFLSGGVISPLLGASLGAAAGLVIKSKTLQDTLFGEEKDGSGILPEQISKFITDKLPTMAGFGFVGALSTLLPFIPGGPVAGLLVGGALGFLKQNNAVTEFLFGSEESDSGLFTQKFQERVKKALPNMGAGAIAGLIAGPFGVVGNVIAGSAIGYLTTTEKFKELVFGDKETGELGLLGWIREDLFKPFKEGLVPIAKELQFGVKKTVKSFESIVYNVFKEHVGIPLNRMITDKIGKPLEKIFGSLIKPIKALIKSPFSFIGGVGEKLKRTQIRKGRATYMTAAERLAYRDEKGMANDKMFKFDSEISKITDKTELSKIKTTLDEIQNPKKAAQSQLTKNLQVLANKLSDLDVPTGKIKKIISCIKDADYSKAISIGSSYAGATQLIEHHISKHDTFSKKLEDTKQTVANAINDMKNKFGIDINEKNAWQFSDLLNGEKKGRNRNEKKAELEATPTEALIAESNNHLNNIATMLKDFFYKKSTGVSMEPDSTWTNPFNPDEQVKPTVSATAENAYKTSTQLTDAGMIKTTVNNQGESTPDLKDKATQDTLKKQDDINNAQIEIAENTGKTASGLTGIFSKLFGEKKDKEETVFDKILNFFTGKGLFSMSGILSGVIGTVLIGLGLTGGLDGIGSMIESTISKMLGGNDPTGSESTNSLSDGLQNSVARDALGIASSTMMTATGRGGVLPRLPASIFSKTGVGKLFNNAADMVGTGLNKVYSNIPTTTVTDVADDAATLAKKTILSENTVTKLTKLSSILKTIPGLSAAGPAIDSVLASIAKETDKALLGLGKLGFKEVLDTVGNFFVVAQVALVIADFYFGYQNARSTLGITGSTTEGQKLLSGFLRALKNLIPWVGVLIPDKFIIDLFIKFIAPALGLDMTDLEQKRTAATEEVTAYNEANGTNYTIEDYNKKVKPSSTVERLSNAFSTASSSIKKNGIGGAIKQYLAKDQSLMTENIAKDGFLKGGAETLRVMMPVLADPFAGIMDLADLMLKGDMKGLWAYNSSSSEEGFLGRSYGWLQMLAPKLVMTIPTIFHESINKSLDALKPMIEPLTKGTIDNIGLMAKAIKGDINGVIDTKSTVEDEGFIGDVLRGDLILRKFMALPVAVLSKGAQETVKVMSKFIDPIKNGVKDNIGLMGKAIKGDINGVIDTKSTVTEEGFVGDMFRNDLVARKVVSLPIALLSKGVQETAKFMGNLIDPISNGIQDNIGLTAKALKGDISGVIDTKSTVTESGFVGEMFRNDLLLRKVMALPVALVSKGTQESFKMFGFLSNKITGMALKFKTDLSIEKEITEIDKVMSEDGAGISDIFAVKSLTPTNTPTGAIKNVIFGISKVAYSIVWALTDALKPITDLVDKAAGKVKTAANWIGDNASEAVGKFTKPVVTGAQKAATWFSNTEVGKFAGRMTDVKGSGSFISQKDSRYGSQKYSNSNISEEGCGPAVAAMAINGSYSNNLVSMKDTVAYARRNKYESGNGTSADYFEDVFNNYGMSTEYIDNTGKGNRNAIENNIRSGKPTVLLGNDSKNKSKAKSPFGPGNHYVLATGMDKSGNVIVNDPEAKGPKKYSKNILNSTKLGIAATKSGGSFITNKFISSKSMYRKYAGGGTSLLDNAVSIIMAQEGSYDSVNANDNGAVSIGKIQWHADRAKSLLKTICGKLGNTASTILGSSLYNDIMGTSSWAKKTFTKNSTEVKALKSLLATPESKAAQDELCSVDVKSYIQAGISAGIKDPKALVFIADVTNQHGNAKSTITKAISLAGGAAKVNLQFVYDAYISTQGTKYKDRRDKVFNALNGINIDNLDLTFNGSTGTSSSLSSTASSVVGGVTGGLTQLTSLFTKLAADKFGKVGELFGLSSGDTTATASTTPFTSSAFSSTGVGSTDKQKALVETMSSVANKLTYSQSGARNPDTGSADCSSTVNWAYKKILGKDIGSTTNAQISNKNLYDVATGDGADTTKPDPSKLLPGDILLFKRNRPSNTRSVGHVEMYMGDGKMIGHGGPDKGPTVKDLKGKFLSARRAIDFKGATDSQAISQATGRGSGLGQNIQKNNIKTVDFGRYYSASGSGITSASQIKADREKVLKTNAKLAKQYISAGGSDSTVLIPLIKSIITLLNTLASNSDKLNTITELLSNYFASNIDNKSGNTAIINNQATEEYNDNSVKDLIDILNSLAS